MTTRQLTLGNMMVKVVGMNTTRSESDLYHPYSPPFVGNAYRNLDCGSFIINHVNDSCITRSDIFRVWRKYFMANLMCNETNLSEGSPHVRNLLLTLLWCSYVSINDCSVP